jgi:hypothetical protein
LLLDLVTANDAAVTVLDVLVDVNGARAIANLVD